MALDSVTSFLCLNDVTNTRKRMRHSLSIGGSSSVQWRKVWKKLITSNVSSLFFVCLNRNRSALVRELLSNNSLFVSQLYEDKSLALHARDLIFLTTDLLTVNYYTTIHC